MAGLLDSVFGAPGSDQSQAMGLLAAGLVSGRFGDGLASATQVFSPEAQLKRQMGALQLQQGQMSLDETRRKLADDAATRQVLQDFYSQRGMPQGQSPQPQSFGAMPGVMGMQTQPTAQPMPQGMPQGMPGAPSQAAGMPTPKAEVWKQYQMLGDQMNARGIPDRAQAYYALAEKFRPKYSPELRQVTDPATGKLINVMTSEDGTITPVAYGVKPDMVLENLGGTSRAIDKNTLTGGDVFRRTPSPDALLSDARARQMLTKDYIVAGFNPDGTPAADLETTARAIANGQLPPPSGMALTNPKNQRILSRVMEINPNYDYTTMMAKKKAAADFTTGQQGNSLRSFAVAGQHLDQLNTLVDAMNSGNYPLMNKVANTFATQTGNTAPTNFDAAKDVVSKEVMKAIVAGGGGVGEREELQKTMDSAKTPAQLKGVIQQYRNLMAAQHDALLQQRRAAGLPDSTIPSYSDANGSPNGSGDWKYLGTMK